MTVTPPVVSAITAGVLIIAQMGLMLVVAGMRRNVHLANSDFVAQRTRAVHGASSTKSLAPKPKRCNGNMQSLKI